MSRHVTISITGANGYDFAKALTVAPMPWNADATVIGVWCGPWEEMAKCRRARLIKLAEDWSAHVSRDVRWVREGSLWWCGPLSYGGDLHRDLARHFFAREVEQEKIIAFDWRTRVRRFPVPAPLSLFERANRTEEHDDE